jgi:hypothetical protein
MRGKRPSPSLDTLYGIVERVTYRHSENGHTVAKIEAPG